MPSPKKSAAEHIGSQPFIIAVTISHETSTPQVVYDSATTSDPAVIATAAPALTPIEGISTGPVAVATFVDPGGPEDTSDYSATITWGDGSAPDTSAAISFDAASNTFSVLGTHTYVEESALDHPNSTPYKLTVVVHHEAAPDSNLINNTATVSDPSVIGVSAAPIAGRGRRRIAWIDSGYHLHRSRRA